MTVSALKMRHQHEVLKETTAAGIPKIGDSYEDGDPRGLHLFDHLCDWWHFDEEWGGEIPCGA